jgi:cytochrome c-type biogenesis protein CcmH
VNKFLLVLCLLTFPLLAQSQAKKENQEPLKFASVEQQERFNTLTEELRCLVCQNQNLADSDAPLAHDLRDEIFEMLQTGKSNDEIKSFLVERYGDFVLYQPPVKKSTLVLWLAPGLMLLGGGLVVVSIVRKRSRMLTTNGSEDT